MPTSSLERRARSDGNIYTSTPASSAQLRGLLQRDDDLLTKSRTASICERKKAYDQIAKCCSRTDDRVSFHDWLWAYNNKLTGFKPMRMGWCACGLKL
jgi:hypothetical protein